MKPQPQLLEVSGFEDLETAQAEIRVNAAMYKALYDMYQNPSEALPRELQTNVWDAYVALGGIEFATANPPKLSLPTLANPFYIVEDFGIGMSKKELFSTFNNFNESDKTKDNVTAGAFGMGAKIPHAVTDQWFVESCKDGVLCKCVMSKDAEGIPTMSLLSETKVSQHSGTKITVPIKPGAVTFVTEAARRCLQYSDIPWIVDGQFWGPFSHTTMSSVNGIKYWTGNNSGAYNSHCLVGPVQYNLAAARNWLSNMFYHFTIQMPIGSVDLVPSRDSILFSDRTKIALENAAELIFKDALKKAQDRVSKQACLWDARTIAKEYPSFLHGALLWDNAPLLDQLRWNGSLDLVLNLADDTTSITTYQYNPNAQTPNVNSSLSIDFFLDYTFFIDDLPRGGKALIKTYTQNEKTNTKTISFRALNSIELKCAIADLRTISGGVPFKLSSALPKPEKEFKDKSSKAPVVKVPRTGNGSKDSDLVESGYFVITKYGDEVGTNSNFWHWAGVPQPLYLVPASRISETSHLEPAESLRDLCVDIYFNFLPWYVCTLDLGYMVRYAGRPPQNRSSEASFQRSFGHRQLGKSSEDVRDLVRLLSSHRWDPETYLGWIQSKEPPYSMERMARGLDRDLSADCPGIISKAPRFTVEAARLLRKIPELKWILDQGTYNQNLSPTNMLKVQKWMKKAPAS